MKLTATHKKIGLTALALGTLAFFVFRKPKSEKGAAIDPTQVGTHAGGSAPSAPAFNAKNIAEGLYRAMEGCGWLTSAERDYIMNTLTRISEAQFAQVRSEFGIRSYNDQLNCQTSLNPFTSLPLVNLPGWLKNELKAADYTVLRLRFPNHLT